jgi:hypothetical protein
MDHRAIKPGIDDRCKQMAKQNEHGKLIAAAAKAALAPLGCCRLGQSRTWISDERFWAIQIEFQPSGWSKGSYLNVGVAWLWHARKDLAFNVGYRVADFIAFESVEQFTPLIEQMAKAAAYEVTKIRERFKSFNEIHDYLNSNLSDGWSLYHAAVTLGLAGDAELSKQLFARFDAWCDLPHWRTKIESESRTLVALLSDPPQFQAVVSAIINRCRLLNGLPLDPNCLEDVNPTLAR